MAAGEALRQKSHGASRFLVSTEGGHPTRSQMEKLKRALEGRNRGSLLTAIISPSAALRFVTSALAFVNPGLRCYAPAHHDKAFAYLGLTGAEEKKAEATLERLRARVRAGENAA